VADTLGGVSVGRQQKNAQPWLRLDKRDTSRHGQTAMTTALTRVPASQTGLIGACALFIFVVISILPH
jgi:hypothetical protein